MPSVLAGSGSGSAFFPQVSTASASVASMLQWRSDDEEIDVEGPKPRTDTDRQTEKRTA